MNENPENKRTTLEFAWELLTIENIKYGITQIIRLLIYIVKYIFEYIKWFFQSAPTEKYSNITKRGDGRRGSFYRKDIDGQYQPTRNYSIYEYLEYQFIIKRHRWGIQGRIQLEVFQQDMNNFYYTYKDLTEIQLTLMYNEPKYIVVYLCCVLSAVYFYASIAIFFPYFKAVAKNPKLECTYTLYILYFSSSMLIIQACNFFALMMVILYYFFNILKVNFRIR